MRVLLVVLAVLTGLRAAVADELRRFVDGLPDVPLASGFAEMAEDRMQFDKTDALIVETVLVGPGEAADALRFYDEALPQLGWRKAAVAGRANRIFERDGHRMRLDAFGRDNSVEIHLFLEPRETAHAQRGFAKPADEDR